MSKFSERLRSLREGRDMSQMELSKQLGISKSSVNMYERGEREPGLETLEAIADYFNVDMDYLLGKSNYRNKAKLFGGNLGLEELYNPLSPPLSVSHANFPRLKELRESRGFSPDKVACQIGISVEEYHKIESGEDTRFLVLVRLADVYRCSIDYLLSYLWEIEGVDPVSELSATEQSLLHKYRSLSPCDQEMVVTILDKFICSDQYKKPSNDNSSAMNA